MAFKHINLQREKVVVNLLSLNLVKTCCKYYPICPSISRRTFMFFISTVSSVSFHLQNIKNNGVVQEKKINE